MSGELLSRIDVVVPASMDDLRRHGKTGSVISDVKSTIVCTNVPKQQAGVRPLKWPINLILSLLAVAASISSASTATGSDAQLIAKGQYLAQAGDCVSCHTAPNGKPYAGGLSMQTPFGPLQTPNITPDKETGIGNWSDDDFYRVMHEGIGKDGEYLYPVMPFPWYTIVTREDALAIKAYLFSLQPQHNPRPANTLNFPFNIRTSLLAWREAFFKPDTFQPDSKQSAAVNRGSYLVNGLAHCGECHNARPVAGTSRWRESLAGGIVENWYAPNISSDVHSGIGAWSNADLVSYLKTGTAPGKGVAVGPMAEAVHALSHLTDDDLGAIAAYLKTTTAVASSKGIPDPAQPFERGAQTYLNYCASCHGVNGQGQGKSIPALKGNPVVLTEGPQNAISVVLGGLEAKGTYAPMLAIGASMRDDEVADVVNYVRQAWGNNVTATASAGMVEKLRASTDTLYTAFPLTSCPVITNASLAKALGSVQMKQQLAGLNDENMYKNTQTLVSSARSAAPGAAQDDLINAFAASYCGLVKQDAKLDQQGRALKMGRFVESIYMAASAGGSRH